MQPLLNIWTAIEPTVIDGMKALIGAGVAFALAWLYRHTAALKAANEAALKVELQSRAQPMTSQEKFDAAKQLAMERLAPAALGARIERALPKVRERAGKLAYEDRATSPLPPPPRLPSDPINRRVEIDEGDGRDDADV